MEVLGSHEIRLGIRGVRIPLGRIHTAYIGEDSSILQLKAA